MKWDVIPLDDSKTNACDWKTFTVINNEVVHVFSEKRKVGQASRLRYLSGTVLKKTGIWVPPFVTYQGAAGKIYGIGRDKVEGSFISEITIGNNNNAASSRALFPLGEFGDIPVRNVFATVNRKGTKIYFFGGSLFCCREEHVRSYLFEFTPSTKRIRNAGSFRVKQSERSCITSFSYAEETNTIKITTTTTLYECVLENKRLRGIYPLPLLVDKGPNDKKSFRIEDKLLTVSTFGGTEITGPTKGRPRKLRSVGFSETHISVMCDGCKYSDNPHKHVVCTGDVKVVKPKVTLSDTVRSFIAGVRGIEESEVSMSLLLGNSVKSDPDDVKVKTEFSDDDATNALTQYMAGRQAFIDNKQKTKRTRKSAKKPAVKKASKKRTAIKPKNESESDSDDVLNNWIATTKTEDSDDDILNSYICSLDPNSSSNKNKKEKEDDFLDSYIGSYPTKDVDSLKKENSDDESNNMIVKKEHIDDGKKRPKREASDELIKRLKEEKDAALEQVLEDELDNLLENLM